MDLQGLVKMSNTYGSNEDYVLAGGGNTSFKENGVLAVKASGTTLATIKADGFVKMDMAKLLEMLEKDYPTGDAERESAALEDMMSARLTGEENKRPSVECILHGAIYFKYVLHLHPALVNGLTCSKNAGESCKKILGDSVLWVPLTKPGYILGKVCYKAFADFKAIHGEFPKVIVLENHGIFVAADTTEEIDQLMTEIMGKLQAMVKEKFDATEVNINKSAVAEIAPVLRMLYSPEGSSVALFHGSKGAVEFAQDKKSMEPLMEPFTPDHIVYCKDSPLYIEQGADYQKAFKEYAAQNGYAPKIVMVKGLGFFALGKSYKEADTARRVWVDALKIGVYAKSFGGAQPLTRDYTDFILNWEIESYRQKVSIGSGAGAKRMQGKICIVTGGAQGFGEGIVNGLVEQGAMVAIADLNLEGAKKLAGSLNANYGVGTAIAVQVDVSKEADVANMVQEAVYYWGGLDLMVSNAGIAIAGDLTEMTKERFELVSSINYTGYFMCTKYASVPMKLQKSVNPSYMMDIIEVNSKSGLVGSNKNFAYAGSKFGGIGLTQSFALELVPFGIKVNAVCPGNLLDGPLWSDPEKGLFKQYFEAGKVKGAKSVEDVRRHYESLVPMNRGCTVEDVSCAVFYLVEQKYETGQALPVTGGQVMLK